MICDFEWVDLKYNLWDWVSYNTTRAYWNRGNWEKILFNLLTDSVGETSFLPPCAFVVDHLVENWGRPVSSGFDRESSLASQLWISRRRGLEVFFVRRKTWKDPKLLIKTEDPEGVYLVSNRERKPEDSRPAHGRGRHGR